VELGKLLPGLVVIDTPVSLKSRRLAMGDLVEFPTVAMDVLGHRG
jgi:hypothetical protein